MVCAAVDRCRSSHAYGAERQADRTVAECSLCEGLRIGSGTSRGGVHEALMDEEVVREPEDGVYAVTRVGRWRWHCFAACGARS